MSAQILTLRLSTDCKTKEYHNYGHLKQKNVSAVHSKNRKYSKKYLQNKIFSDKLFYAIAESNICIVWFNVTFSRSVKDIAAVKELLVCSKFFITVSQGLNEFLRF